MIASMQVKNLVSRDPRYDRGRAVALFGKYIFWISGLLNPFRALQALPILTPGDLSQERVFQL